MEVEVYDNGPGTELPPDPDAEEPLYTEEEKIPEGVDFWDWIQTKFPNENSFWEWMQRPPEESYPTDLGEPEFEARDAEGNPKEEAVQFILGAGTKQQLFSKFNTCTTHKVLACPHCTLACSRHGKTDCLGCLQSQLSGGVYTVNGDGKFKLQNTYVTAHSTVACTLNDYPDPKRWIDIETELLFDLRSELEHFEVQSIRKVFTLTLATGDPLYQGTDAKSMEYLKTLVILKRISRVTERPARLTDTTKRVISDDMVEYTMGNDYMDVFDTDIRDPHENERGRDNKRFNESYVPAADSEDPMEF